MITKNRLHLNERNLNILLKEKKIFLVGFMATGKTTVGRTLAKKLSMPFLDSDKEIENKLNMSITNIFEKYGESEFRNIEEKIILNYIERNNSYSFIMSLGGGAFINKNIRKIIKAYGVSVWLNTNIEIINLRIKNSKHTRPLLKKFNTTEKLDSLMIKRSEYYSKADIKIDIINTSKEKMMHLVLDKITNYCKS